MRAGPIASGDTGWWFDRHRPDCIVFHKPIWTAFEAPAAARAAFAEQYRRLPVRLPGPGLSVYQRIEAPAATPR